MEKVNFSQLLTCLQYYSFERNFSFTWTMLYSLLSRRHGVRFSSGAPRLQQELSLADYLTLKESVLPRHPNFVLLCCPFFPHHRAPTAALILYTSPKAMCLVGVGHSSAFPSISPSPSCRKPQPASAASVLPAEGICPLHQSQF